MEDKVKRQTVTGWGPVNSIVIFRALALGDMLCGIPAVRSLRSAFPKARITLACLPWGRILPDLFPHYFDDVLEFPGYPGLPESECLIEKVPDFFKKCQSRKFDLAVQLHGNGTLTNALTLLMGARITCGFYKQNGFCPDENTFMVYPEAGHEIRRNLGLMRFLGIPPQGEHLEFPLAAEDLEGLRGLQEAAILEKEPYLCIHAGSRMPTRRWTPERFAKAGDYFYSKGYRIALTGSGREEAALAETVLDAMKSPAINLAGKTDLRMFAALLSRARLLISNDTGVSHIAAALKVPSVILVTASDPERWAPLDGYRHEILYKEDIGCRPCSHWQCPIGHPCSELIGVDEVIERAELVLARFAMEEPCGEFAARNAALAQERNLCGRFVS